MRNFVIATRPGRPDVSLEAEDEMDAVSRALDAGLIADDEEGSIVDVVGMGAEPEDD
jgi:hypothetical protein